MMSASVTPKTSPPVQPVNTHVSTNKKRYAEVFVVMFLYADENLWSLRYADER